MSEVIRRSTNSSEIILVMIVWCNSATLLGKLEAWNVNYTDVEELRGVIQSCNMELELWEILDSFDREDAMEKIHQNEQGDGSARNGWTGGTVDSMNPIWISNIKVVKKYQF